MGRPSPKRSRKAAARRREKAARAVAVAPVSRAERERHRPDHGFELTLEGAEAYEAIGAYEAALACGCACSCSDHGQEPEDLLPLDRLVRELAGPRGQEACLAAALGAAAVGLVAWDRGQKASERALAHRAAGTLQRTLYGPRSCGEEERALQELDQLLAGRGAEDLARQSGLALRHALLCARAPDAQTALEEAVRAVLAAAQAVAQPGDAMVRTAVHFALGEWERIPW